MTLFGLQQELEDLIDEFGGNTEIKVAENTEDLIGKTVIGLSYAYASVDTPVFIETISD